MAEGNRRSFLQGFFAGVLATLLLAGAAGAGLSIYLYRVAAMQQARAVQAAQQAEEAHRKTKQPAVRDARDQAEQGNNEAGEKQRQKDK
jgi:hypothetical protein